MMRRLLFLSLLSICLQTSYAQETGIVRFFVPIDNGYFEIEINDTILLRRYKDTLPAGKYEAKVWSPGYVTALIDFEVKAGQVTEKHVEMAKNNDYIQYEYDYRDYRMQFHKHFTTPLSGTIAMSLLSGGFMLKAFDTKKKITTDIELYDITTVTEEIDLIKERITVNRQKYNRQRFWYYAGAGLTGVGIVGTIWLYKRFVQNYTEPTFNKESPFKDKFSLTVNPYGCGIALNL